MRSPSRLLLESAPAYAVRRPFTIGRPYLVGEIIDGDLARSWATFRALIDLPWLIPVTAVAPDVVAPVRVDKRLKANRDLE